MFKSLKHTKKEKQSSVNSKSHNGSDQSYDHQHETESENKIRSYQLKADKQNENSSLSAIQKKSNGKSTGLPEGLRSGVESLSGKDMSDVNVHYNSDKPQKIGALAYAQGTNIHVGKGQERHLPHEAWHVVQQKQGRVKPTIQKKGNIPVNDDTSLEKEADLMGDEANELGDQVSDDTPLATKNPIQKVVQRIVNEEDEQELEIPDAEKILSKQSNLSGNENDSEDSAEDESSGSIEIKSETLVLSGQKGLYAKISSFFGKETSFGELQNLIKDYENIEDEQEKNELKDKIVQACDNWLKKHPKPKKSKSLFGRLKSGFNKLKGKTANDNKKRESISLIRNQFLSTEKVSNIKLTTLSDKQSLTSKIKGLFGFKTTFKQIEEKYHEYQSSATKEMSNLKLLTETLQKANDIVQLIKHWEKSHREQNEEDQNEQTFKGSDQGRQESLEKIKRGIAGLYIEANIKNIVRIKVSGLKLEELDKGLVKAENVELEVKINDKKITGKGDDVSIGPNGVDFSKISLDYNDSFEIMEGFEVSETALSISHQADNYIINVSGNIDINYSSPNFEITSAGGGAVSYETKSSSFKNFELEDVSISASLLNNNLEVSAENINYAGGVFSAENGKVSLKPFGLTSDIENISFNKEEGMDWSSIKVKVDREFDLGGVVSVKNPKAEVKGKSDDYAYNLEGGIGINVPTPDGLDFSTSGLVNVSGIPNVNEYDVTVNHGKVKLKFGEIFTGQARGLEYDSGKNELFGSSLQINLNLFDNKLKANVDEFSVAEDGVDWKLASFSAKELKLNNFIKATDVNATVAGKSNNYEKTAEASFDKASMFDNDLANINMKGITLKIAENDKKWDFEVAGNEVNVDMFGGSLTIKSTSFEYKNNSFKMGGLDIGISIPFAGKLSGSGENVTIDQNGVDWTELSLNSSTGFSLGSGEEKPLSFKAGNAKLKGKKENYKLGLELGADLNAGPVKGKGQASLLWVYTKPKELNVEDYSLTLGGKSPKIPDSLLPGLWPISFSLAMPFPAGPIPLEAGLKLEASGGAVLGIEGTIRKAGENTILDGIGKANPELSVGIEGSLGIGSGMLIKLAGFIAGKATALSRMNLNLNGEIDKNYNLISLAGDYVIDSEFLAKLTAGVKVQALVIFEKKLYEVVLKEWVIGGSKLTGKYDFKSKEGENGSQGVKKTGLFKTGKGEITGEDIPAPEVEVNTKEYLLAMEKFNEILISENPSEKIETISITDNSETDFSYLKSKKEKLITILDFTINLSLSNEDFISYKEKLETDKNALDKVVKKYNEYIEKNEIKGKQAKAGTLKLSIGQMAKNKFFNKRDEAYYMGKVERKKIEFQDKVQKDLDKVKVLEGQIAMFENQIQTSETYKNNIDVILDNSEVGVAEIDAQIAEYKSIKNKGLKHEYSLSNFLKDTKFAKSDIDLEIEE